MVRVFLEVTNAKVFVNGKPYERGARLEVGVDIAADVATEFVSHGIAIYGAALADTTDSLSDAPVETAAVEPVVEKAVKKRGRPRKKTPTLE